MIVTLLTTLPFWGRSRSNLSESAHLSKCLNCSLSIDRVSRIWHNRHMELTKEYLKEEIGKINKLLLSGSLHEVDEASHISARLIGELSEQKISD